MSTNERSVSIFVTEPDCLLRHFLLAKLADYEEFVVLGSAGDEKQTLEAIASLSPDVLLLDLSLPELSRRQLLEQLSARERPVAVLVLSGDESEQTQLDAARYGVKGFLGKSQVSASLSEALRAVAAGELWLSRTVVAQILNEYPTLARERREQSRAVNQLTQREREVLVRVVQGRTNHQIASELYMGVSTVKVHIRNIFKRLGLSGRTEAAVFAVQEGLLERAECESTRGGVRVRGMRAGR